MLPIWTYNGQPINDYNNLLSFNTNPKFLTVQVGYLDGCFVIRPLTTYLIRTALPKLDGSKRKLHVRFVRTRFGTRIQRCELYKEFTNWLSYHGGLSERRNEITERKILQVAKNRKELEYLTAMELFKVDALRNPKNLNQSILGQLYRKDFEGANNGGV